MVERLSGNLPAQAGVTLVSALAGSPVAALLPLLVGTLAGRRHAARIERHLTEIANELQKHSDLLGEISDRQYNIINEAIVAALHTTEDEKLSLLKNCVQNTLEADKFGSQEAILISRIIRDISVEEANFLLLNRNVERVHVRTQDAEPLSQDEKYLRVAPNSDESLIVDGLLALGVLTPGEPTLEQSLTFSRIAPVVVSLLESP